MNKFKKEVLLYGFAIALNKGSLLLFMPPIVAMLGVTNYGIYTYLIALVYVLAPILSLNISAGIVREGVDNIKKATYIQRSSAPYIIIVGILFTLILEALNFHINIGQFVGITIMLAVVEALSNGLLAHYRANEKHYFYFIYSFLKVLCFILIIYILNEFDLLSLKNLLYTQLALNAFLYFIFSYRILFKFEITQVSMRTILLFTGFLLPHTLAQWALNASNRIVIKTFVGDKELGIFSIAFSLASVAMVMNSGIALVIPQHLMKNYEKWTSSKFINKFYIIYSAVFLGVYLALLIGIFVDSLYFNIIKHYSSDVIKYMTFVFLGFYLLGYYYYYSNILFYHRKSKLISKVTIITSILSILITICLTFYFSTIGAAISSFVSYFIYFIFIFLATISIERKLKSKFSGLLLIILLSTSTILFLMYMFNLYLFF